MPLSPGGEGSDEDFVLDVVLMHKLFVEARTGYATVCVGDRMTFSKLGHLELGT